MNIEVRKGHQLNYIELISPCFPCRRSEAKIGTRLWALMASRGRESSWLKLRWVMGRFSRHDSEGWWVPLGWLEEIWIAGDDVNMRFEEASRHCVQAMLGSSTSSTLLVG